MTFRQPETQKIRKEAVQHIKNQAESHFPVHKRKEKHDREIHLPAQRRAGTATAADARSLFRSKRSRTNTAAAIALGMAAYTLYNGYNTYREDAAGRPYLREKMEANDRLEREDNERYYGRNDYRRALPDDGGYYGYRYEPESDRYRRSDRRYRYDNYDDYND